MATPRTGKYKRSIKTLRRGQARAVIRSQTITLLNYKLSVLFCKDQQGSGIWLDPDSTGLLSKHPQTSWLARSITPAGQWVSASSDVDAIGCIQNQLKNFLAELFSVSPLKNYYITSESTMRTMVVHSKK